MNLRNRVTRWATKLIPAAVLGFFITGGIMTATANSPQFNILNEDFPTLMVEKPGQAWGTSGTSLNANVGDVVWMQVWAHNGVVNTTAIDSRAKVILPGEGVNHVATGQVWASNASVKSGNASVNVGVQSKLTYIPGSAQLLKNVNNQMTVVSWPQGVNGDDIVSANGVKIGNIEGCWQFAEAVRIQVRVEGVNAQITTNKRVAKASEPFVTDTTAQPADAAEYRIYVENTGNGTARAPKVVDILDAKTKYIPGTSFARVKQNGNDYDQPIPDSNIVKETLADGRTKLTYYFVDLQPGAQNAFYLHFMVRLEPTNVFPIGTTVIPNTADACATNVACVSTNQTTITVVRQNDQVISFSLIKDVRNRTNGDTMWKDQLVGSAATNDEVEYRLTVTNTGNTTAQNVTLKDILPAGVQFVSGHTFLYNKNTGTAGQAISGNAIVNSGYVFSSIEAGTQNQQVIIFRAKVTDNVQCPNTATKINKGQVIFQNNVKVEDTATFILGCKGLIIQKDVKDRNGNFVDDGGIFTESEVVTYRIVVTNNGATTVNNPVIRDILPANVTYVTGSLAIDGEFLNSTLQNAFFNNGVTLTNFTAGMSKTITFKVRIIDCPNLGDTRLVNVAKLYADGVAEKQDTAVITVRVNRPGLTW
jgi:uncharacterized repeat protein (TIGR01451 family)